MKKFVLLFAVVFSVNVFACVCGNWGKQFGEILKISLLKLQVVEKFCDPVLVVQLPLIQSVLSSDTIPVDETLALKTVSHCLGSSHFVEKALMLFCHSAIGISKTGMST